MSDGAGDLVKGEGDLNEREIYEVRAQGYFNHEIVIFLPRTVV